MSRLITNTCCSALLAVLVSRPLLAGCDQVDLTAYFVPNYSGWDTAKRSWIDSSGGSNTERWFSYGTGKYEHIKFSNPSSAETFAIDGNWIYITGEFDQNNTSTSRTWPAGSYGLGLTWLPRFGNQCTACTPLQTANCNIEGSFIPCNSGQNSYNSCQFVQSYPHYCAANYTYVYFVTYNYGYSIGSLPSIIKHDTLDNNYVENYYYGLGRGLLRFEMYDANGYLVQWAAQTGETANQPISDQICFHP